MAEIGQAQLARAAQQEPLAELRLEGGDAPRHGRFGQARLRGGAAETAGLADARGPVLDALARVFSLELSTVSA